MDVYRGTFIHCKQLGEVEILENFAIAVRNGKITAINKQGDIKAMLEENNLSCEKITNSYNLDRKQFIIPGFVDAHIHAAQFENAGLGYDKTLLDWLNAYTFPLEKKFKDINYAETVYEKVVDTTLKNGTTTASYFGTIHAGSCLKLVNIIRKKRQRALVGKVNMNMNAPEYLTEKSEKSIEDTRQFIESVLDLKDPLVLPIITPRFAVSCDFKLLEKLGSIRQDFNCHVQTHVSENVDEINFVQKLFPNAGSYTEVYKKANLLGQKTILAHGVHLTDNELLIIRDSQAAVIHCPASNMCLKSGLCNVRRLLNKNIKVGLGTDVAGGYNPTILDAMRRTVDVSNIVFNFHPEFSPLTYKEAFYLATVGGAEALSMGDRFGNFEVGKEFDALLINMRDDSTQELTSIELFQKFFYLGDDRNIQNVFVAGERVI